MIRVREIDPKDARRIRRRLVLDHCKWDPQVGDRDALPPYALVIDRAEWSKLARWAEALARELLAVEAKLALRDDLDAALGVPRSLRRLVRSRGAPTPTLARTMRFDFHPTRDGWALSEVNADVPGGFTEGSCLPSLVAEALSLQPTGDPLRAFIDAATSRMETGDAVVLVSAPGFIEDHQVTTLLGRAFEARGHRAILGNAASLRFVSRRARIAGSDVGAIVRFYQAEWIASIREAESLAPLFVGGDARVTNPLGAALTESKRLPLVLDALHATTLRAAFPDTHDARFVPWRTSPEAWVLKKTYSNTGDAVIFPERLGRAARAMLALEIAAAPTRWVAQRRFEIETVDSPDGPLRACVGVFTIDGAAAGSYVRVSPDAIINHGAMDVALLLS